MKKTSGLFSIIGLVALFIVCGGCTSVQKIDPVKKFVSDNPGYCLTPFPLLAIKREAFFRYQRPAIDIAWLKRSAEKMSKEEFLKELDRKEQLYLKCYKDASEVIAEIEHYLNNGAAVYWYSGPEDEEEGYIVIGADGKILRRPLI